MTYRQEQNDNITMGLRTEATREHPSHYSKKIQIEGYETSGGDEECI
jgi:hypothetical protein